MERVVRNRAEAAADKASEISRDLDAKQAMLGGIRDSLRGAPDRANWRHRYKDPFGSRHPQSARPPTTRAELEALRELFRQALEAVSGRS